MRDSVTGEMSSERLVTRGVPQSSVLGPQLFVLYLSDFRGVLEHYKYNFYADDLLIYLHSEPRELRSGIAKVNDDIINVVKWAAGNELTFNANKTTTMMIGTARYVNSISFDISSKDSYERCCSVCGVGCLSRSHYITNTSMG